MKQKISLSKRKILTALLCTAGIFALLMGAYFTGNANRRFQNICDQLFQEEMQGNTLTMHYTIANPEDFGITDYEAILPCYVSGNREESNRILSDYLTRLGELNREKLSPENAYALNMLTSYLENSLTLNQFAYYDEPLSPASGMQSQLPILLAEYTFRSKKDVEDYLSLLDQTDEYFASLLTYEQEKAGAGLLMAASSLDEVIEQCDTILTKKALKEGSHFLQTTFQERLTPLYEQGLITDQERKAFLSQNDRLLSTVMLPAYEALGDGLLILQDERISLAGLASFPQGKEYYEALLLSQTGSNRSVEEIKQMLVDKLDSEFSTLIPLLTQYDEEYLTTVQTSLPEVFPVAKADDMLHSLIRQMRADFPTLLQDDQTAPCLAIKNVSPSLEEYCAPAFYLTPPLDDTDSNVIYINQKDSPQALELFTTLAHEGYPGHMYQSVYSNNLLAKQDSGTIRGLLWYGGYMEGWALYVEFLSYDYASELLENAGYSSHAEYVQIEKHSRCMQLCLYSLLDIMIHYENASYNQVHKMLSSFGITSPVSTAAIYKYIVEEPTNYLKYYLGYLEILNLRDEAHTLWGDAYQTYDFHKFLLDYGPADFATLKEQLHALEH